MGSRQGAVAAIVATLLLAVAPVASGEEQTTEQTRATYKAQVEPVCKRDTLRSRRILRGVEKRIKHQKLVPAGHQFLHVSRTFGQAIGQIVKVPPPPADAARLKKWVKYLRIVERRFRKLGVYLVHKQRTKATHESIRAERAGNTANNISFPFGFHYCRLTREHFH